MFAVARTSNLLSGQVPLEISRPLAAGPRLSSVEVPPCLWQGGSLTGQATLAFILLVSGVVLEVAVAGSFVTYFLNSAGFGERLSARALVAAQAGVEDVTLQVVRNKEFVTAGTATYTFVVGSDTASVSISRTTDSAAGTYLYSITATGVAGTRQRRLAARMAVNQTTGLAELQEVREQSVD